MAQYDLLLTQNVAAAGIEFTEQYINIAKGGLMSANASGVPTVLPAGSDGFMLVRDNNEATGLKWVSVSIGHTQNTDTGTTSPTFQLDSGNTGARIKNNTGILEARNAADNAYADFRAKNATFDKVTVTAAPQDGSDLVNKTYADGLIAANDAMVYKGVINCSANPNYPAADAGHTYKISAAGKIGGAAGINVEIGDMIICNVDSTASGDHATVGSNWTIIQTNLDGAVIGPASATNNALVLFDGTTGKLIKAGTGAPGTMAYENAVDYVTKALYDANTILAATTDNTPAALTVGEQTLLGRRTSSGIAALTPAEAMNVLWVSAPAAKNSTGTAGMIARDTNWFYICTATNTWKRSALATNWS